jgi:hypothetical protein
MASLGRSIVPRRRWLGVDHSLQRFRIRFAQMHVATHALRTWQVITSLTVHGVEVARETSSEIATDRSGFSRPPRTPLQWWPCLYQSSNQRGDRVRQGVHVTRSNRRLFRSRTHMPEVTRYMYSREVMLDGTCRCRAHRTRCCGGAIRNVLL